MTNKTSIWRSIWRLIRQLLHLGRFDLFLQGTLLVLTLLDTYSYLLLKNAAGATLMPYRTLDWVQTGVAAVEVLAGPLVGWYGASKRPYTLAGWLFATAASGLLVLSTAQPHLQEPSVGLCLAGNVLGHNGTDPVQYSEEHDGTQWVRPALLILSVAIGGLARFAVWTLGFTYLDEHDPSNGPNFYGILVSIRVSVGASAEGWLSETAASAGAEWWRAQLSLSMLVLMFAILFCLFPMRMPGYAVPRSKDVPAKDLGAALRRVLSTPSLLAQTAGVALLTAGLWGFAIHEHTYAQARYHTPLAPGWMDGRTSRFLGDIFRSFVVIFFITIFRARFSGRRAEGVKASTCGKVGCVLALLAGLFFVVLSTLRCSAIAPVTGVSDTSYQQPSCSSDCRCSSEEYAFAPVCALDTLQTFYSPCHAGCRTSRDFHNFLMLSDCSCAGSGSAEVRGLAVRGACAIPDCFVMFGLYQVIYVNAFALSGAALLMQNMGVVRSVQVNDRPLAIGTALAFVSLIAYIPGRYLYIYISDATCAWHDENGTCKLHREELAPALSGTTAALILMSSCLSLTAFFLDRRKKRIAMQ